MTQKQLHAVDCFKLPRLYDAWIFDFSKPIHATYWIKILLQGNILLVYFSDKKRKLISNSN